MPFLAVSFSHFVVDTLNGLTPVLVVAFSVPLGLNNAMVGLLSSVYGLAGALFQPLFGAASDRYGGAWISIGGLLWMGIFFTLVCLAPPQAALSFMLVAGLGPGAFQRWSHWPGRPGGMGALSGRDQKQGKGPARAVRSRLPERRPTRDQGFDQNTHHGACPCGMEAHKT